MARKRAHLIPRSIDPIRRMRVVGRLVRRGLDRAPELVRRASGPQLFAGTFGLLAGMLVGAVISAPMLFLLPQVAGWSLSAQDPYNNIARTCIEAMSAVFGDRVQGFSLPQWVFPFFEVGGLCYTK